MLMVLSSPFQLLLWDIFATGKVLRLQSRLGCYYRKDSFISVDGCCLMYMLINEMFKSWCYSISTMLLNTRILQSIYKSNCGIYDQKESFCLEYRKSGSQCFFYKVLYTELHLTFFFVLCFTKVLFDLENLLFLLFPIGLSKFVILEVEFTINILLLPTLGSGLPVILECCRYEIY